MWDGDFTYEDYGIFDQDGLVHVYHCRNCGAVIEYYCPFEQTQEGDQAEEGQQLDIFDFLTETEED
jgi:hypothetical protein